MALNRHRENQRLPPTHTLLGGQLIVSAADHHPDCLLNTLGEEVRGSLKRVGIIKRLEICGSSHPEHYLGQGLKKIRCGLLNSTDTVLKSCMQRKFL